MFTRFTSLVVVGLLAVPAFGQDPAAKQLKEEAEKQRQFALNLSQAKKTDPTAAMLAKLRELANLDKLDAVPLRDLVDHLGNVAALPIVVNDEAFKRCGEGAIGDAQLRFPRTKGLRLRTVLTTALAQKQATFLVRKDHIEILPIGQAARQAKVPVDDDGLAEPLVSVIAKERPLNELVAELAEDYDLNVVVAPQAGDGRTAFVSVRLLNVPADKALDAIATTADLRVVRKGNVFLITSRDHANEMFSEKLEKEKQKIEVEQLRSGTLIPPPVPVPTPPAGKPDEKK